MSIFKHGAVALATLLSLVTLQSAQAARLQIVSAGSWVDLIEQSVTVDGASATRSVTGGLVDGSGVDTVLLSDFQAFGPAALGGASVEDGYSHLMSVDASGASTSLALDASSFWTATGTGSIDAYSLTQSLSLDGLTLRVVADAGEFLGQSVVVDFSGVAEGLLSGAADLNDLGLTLDVLQGATTVASYNGLWTANTTESVSLSFSGVVGDEFTVLLSAYQGASLNTARALTASTEFSGTVNLQGNFAVTAVPEPESWGLALAGLLIAGVAARRRA